MYIPFLYIHKKMQYALIKSDMNEKYNCNGVDISRTEYFYFYSVFVVRN